jgi:hypothetical protein
VLLCAVHKLLEIHQVLFAGSCMKSGAGSCSAGRCPGSCIERDWAVAGSPNVLLGLVGDWWRQIWKPFASRACAVVIHERRVDFELLGFTI